MARILAVIAFAFLAATGCSDDKNPIRQYGNTLTGAVKKADKAKAVADLVAIKSEIMRYKAESGEYPPDLQALKIREIYPDLYSYDPETGAVALKQ
jgi:hypothetical protein